MITGGAVALIVIVATVVVSLFDINSYKPRIEAAASGVTGLDVRINGKVGLSFFPFGVSARDIHVAGKGGEILSLENLKLGVTLISLLKKQLEITRCELVNPTITIAKDAEGRYNFEHTEKKAKKGQPGTGFTLKELGLSKGALVYLDKKTGEKTEFNDLNINSAAFSILCGTPGWS